jgi:uracil-DNA glycosylase
MARKDIDGEIRVLVRRIRIETARQVPDARAMVVMVMLTPGPAPGGAQQTNILSPTTNSDQSALNLRRLMREADLDEHLCVFWNAVPWALERRCDPTPNELLRGTAYLDEFLALVPGRRAVVALGAVAQRACRAAAVGAIEVPSPSPLAVAPPGPLPNSKSRRWVELRIGLERAAALPRRTTGITP